MSDRARGRRRKASSGGGRISSFSASRNKSADSSKKKRPRIDNVAPSRRPDPPPAPPASLVRLLKSDPSVVHYFTSLQENLDWDVQKWKNRARDYQGQLEALQQKTRINSRDDRVRNGNDDDKGPTTLYNDDASSDDPEASNTSTGMNQEEEAELLSPKEDGTKNSFVPPEQGVAIDDSMFDGALSSSSDDDDSDKEMTRTMENPSKKKIQGPSKPIEDHMLNLSSDSSSSSDDGIDNLSVGHRPNTFLRRTENNEDSNMSFKKKLDQTVNQLAEAHRCFERLGISLIEEVLHEDDEPTEVDIENRLKDTSEPSEMNTEWKVTDDDIQSDDYDNDKHMTVRESKTVTKRSVEDIVADICRVIKTLSKVKYSHGDETYSPFTLPELLPCYKKATRITNSTNEIDSIPHPVIEAKQRTLSALVLMDSNYKFLLDGIEDDTFTFSDDNKQDVAATMTGQHKLVDYFVQSLHGEIEQVWAVQDRSTFRRTGTMHFQEDSEALARAQREEQNLAIDTDESSFGQKTNLRLAALLERCILAELLVSIYLVRRDPQRASRLVWNYVMSTAPALGLSTEEYPKFPPALSLCVLESMLCPEESIWLPGPYCRGRWPHQLSSRSNDAVSWFATTVFENPTSFLCRAFAIAIHASACIHEIRRQSSDDRIADLSRVELASYKRLLASQSSWLRMTDFEVTDIDERRLYISKSVDDMISDSRKEGLMSPADRHYSAHSIGLALVLLGEAKKIGDYFDKNFETWKKLSKADPDSERREELNGILHACAMATRHLEVRKLDDYRQRFLSGVFPSTQSRTDYASKIVNFLVQCQFDRFCILSCIETALLCCLEMADGESAILALQLLVRQKYSIVESDQEMVSDLGYDVIEGDMATIERVSVLPTIRVINLERRKDRLSAFMAQARGERLMIVRGVTHMDGSLAEKETSLSDENLSGSKSGRWYGCYAFDGRGDEEVAEERMVVEACDGRHDCLSRLVESQWSPNDLKAFDTAAPESYDLVRISPSEKACALSHAATWMGVRRCLSDLQQTVNQVPQNLREYERRNLLLRHPGHILQQFQVSGFARGNSLLPQNEGASATPVCVILEDDAILTDRFLDRLSMILEELPRDFHYCALGYSRPKTAPMVPYSSQLGIPTCLWYMTGYILSLEGAKYLLGQLPIRGPVDSWVGLMMYSNWDNSFGHALGIGTHARIGGYGNSSSSALPSRKDLRDILRFRVFAALVPLCSQKVGMDAASGGIGSSDAQKNYSWRQRDSDIKYSGSTL